MNLPAAEDNERHSGQAITRTRTGTRDCTPSQSTCNDVASAHVTGMSHTVARDLQRVVSSNPSQKPNRFEHGL